MALPTYDALYLPLLRSLADQAIHTNREIAAFIAKEMSLSPEDLQERLSSGGSVFQNRVGWACTYLNKAGLLQRTSRGHYRLSQEGTAVLAKPPAVLDNAFLSRYPSFQDFYRHTTNTDAPSKTAQQTETPNDQIEQAIRSLNQHLAEELLEAIMAKDAAFFEELVVKLLRKMGYGGALRDEGAAKGLFITTARFSEGARVSAEKQHIVLVDGERLTRLMIEYNIGVSPVARYEIKSLDSDFFDDAD